MAGELGAAAITGGASFLGTLTSQLFAEQNRKRNFYYNEMAADAADARTRALFTDLYSPSAMLEQYKLAGLSPSQMFANGTGGVGSGQAGAQGAGGNGINGSVYGIDPMSIAQIGLIKAQTRKTEAEAANEEGTGAIGSAKVAEILSQAGLNEASKLYTQSLQTGQELQNYITDNTKEYSIAIAADKADKAKYEAESAMWKVLSDQSKAYVDTHTIQAQVENIELINKNLTEQILLKQSETKLNNAKVKEISAQIELINQQTIATHGNLLINAWNAQTKEDYTKNLKAYQDKLTEQIEETIKNVQEMRPYQKAQIVSTIVNESLRTIIQQQMVGVKLIDAVGEIIPG